MRENSEVVINLIIDQIWVKQCHRPPMTTNGKHATYIFMLMTGGWWLWHCLKASTEDMGPIYQAGNQLSWGWIQGNFCPPVLFCVFQRPGDLFLWLSHPTIQKLWLSIRMILYSILYLFLSLKNDMWKQKNENVVNESTSAIIIKYWLDMMPCNL